MAKIVPADLLEKHPNIVRKQIMMAHRRAWHLNKRVLRYHQRNGYAPHPHEYKP